MANDADDFLKEVRAGGADDSLKEGRAGGADDSLKEGRAGGADDSLKEGRAGEAGYYLKEGRAGEAGYILKEGRAGEADDSLKEGRVGEADDSLKKERAIYSVSSAEQKTFSELNMENPSMEEKDMAKIFPEVSEDFSIRTTTAIFDAEPERKNFVCEHKRLSDEIVDSLEEERVLIMESLSIEEKNMAEIFKVSEDSIVETVISGDTPYSSASTFEDLNLSKELLKGLYVNMKFQKPSKIQAISLPMILTPPYKHLVAQAHNGSGKTTCFVLGMLSRVDPSLSVPQALCICPTRELAIQNMGVLKEMGTYTGITAECAVPVPKEDANKKTFRLPLLSQIVIGTPGTVNKLISFKKLGTAGLKVLVFDEADQMLAQDGFQDDSLRIMKNIERSNSDCQVLLFSATFEETVKNFVSKLKISNNCNELFVKKENLSLPAVKQYKVNCPDELSKILVIKDQILELGQKVGQTIIFVNSKRSASMLHGALVKFGYTVTTIHGALTHEDRDNIVKEFKEGLTQVLISTDLLARGFDQEQVNLIINFNMPSKPDASLVPQYETYLHRIGRAGRFGRRGAVFNLLMSDDDRILVEKIEMYYGIHMIEVTCSPGLPMS